MPIRFALILILLSACSAPERSRERLQGLTAGRAELGGAGGQAQLALDGGSAGVLPLAGQGGQGAPAEAECAKATYQGKLRPLDMLVLLDQSGSMTEHDDRWTPTTSAIKRFASASESAGMGMGLQYFPLAGDDDVKCDGATYAELSVAVAPLPGNAQTLIDSIDAHHFTQEDCCDASEHNGTPTRPALEGVYSHLREWIASHPERDAVVLLATDGEPSDVCDGNEVEDVSRVVGEAARATPSLKTYVIGIGDEESLGELAAAGGTGQDAFVVDGTGMKTEAQLLEALAKIRGASLRCDFDVPSGMYSDPNLINVDFSTGAGAVERLVRVAQESDCPKATNGGWFFDAAKQLIQLCPDACQAALTGSTAKVDIVVGCAAVLL